MSNRLVQDSVAIAPSVRTAITAPVDCTVVRLTQTDKANDALVWDLAAGGASSAFARGSQRTFAPLEGPALNDKFSRRPGYRAGEVVCYVEAVAGTGPIAVEITV